MTTTDAHVIDALTRMTTDQVAAWRKHCHTLSQQHEDLTAPLTAIAAVGYDNSLTALSAALSRCDRGALNALAQLITSQRQAEPEASTRNAWRHVENLVWRIEMGHDALGAQLLVPRTADDEDE